MNCLTLFSFFAILVAVCASSEDGLAPDTGLSKRGVLGYASLINTYTDHNALDYLGYGCWCGKGGKGTPVDETDRCCRTHDWCYNALISKGHCSYNFQLYITVYSRSGLKCYTGWWSSRCSRNLCRCDVEGVKCFRRNRFNNKYKKYNKSKFC